MATRIGHRLMTVRDCSDNITMTMFCQVLLQHGGLSSASNAMPIGERGSIDFTLPPGYRRS